MSIHANAAFSYARGAVWHLEVAMPQLRAALDAGERNARPLVDAAAAHLRRAAADHASAQGIAVGRQVAAGDTQLGAGLLAAARDLGGSAVSADAVSAALGAASAAREHAQRGVEALIPQLTAYQDLLPLAPALSAPAHELALVTTVDGARRFLRNSDLQRELHREVLATGRVDPHAIGSVGGARFGNGNGEMPIVRVTHPASEHVELRAVNRPPTAQAAQEEFAYDLAVAGGVDHRFAQAVRREQGDALVELVPGGPLWEQGVDGADDIEDVIANGLRRHFPGLGNDDVRIAAKLERQEATAVDYLDANPDRNSGGGLADRAVGSFRIIDNGFAGRGETADPRVPGMKSHFVGGEAGHAVLLPQAAAELVAGWTDDRLAQVHAKFAAGPTGDLPAGHALALSQDASAGYLLAMRQRRDQLATGAFSYHAIDLMADPLKHMDWLTGGTHPY